MVSSFYSEEARKVGIFRIFAATKQSDILLLKTGSTRNLKLCQKKILIFEH